MEMKDLVFLLETGSSFAGDSVAAKDVYYLVKCLIKAQQMGLNTYGQERTFWEGVAAYGRSDMTEAKPLLAEASQALNFEIANKRKLYTKKFVSTNDVVPVTEHNDAVKIWTLMSSENGDFEWTKAVRDVEVSPNTKWNPRPENCEKGIAVVYGRGTITVDGQKADLFGGDIVAVPPNMPFTLETRGHFPIYVMVSEAYADIRGSELADLEPGVKWTEPWLPMRAQTGCTKDTAQSAFDTSSATMKTAKDMGITPLCEAHMCYKIAEKCLSGGNYDGAFSLSHIANDWIQRSIKELEENKALVASKGVMVANRMSSEVPSYHNETCPAYISSTTLPFKYHEFVMPFEVLAGNRLGPHQHATEELYYVLNGRGKMMIADPAGNRYFEKDQPGIEVNPGTLLFIPVMSLHSLYPVGNASLVHSIGIGTFLNEKNILYDIEMDVASTPWTPESWKNAYMSDS